MTSRPAYRANTYSQGRGNHHNSHFSSLTQTPHPLGQTMFQAPEIYGGPAMGGSPMQIPMNPPGVFGGSSGPNLSGGTNFYSPQRGGTPNFNYGRGRGQRFNYGPRPGRGRNNRGRSGSHNIISAEDRPYRFYDKSMLEDPWKMLKPVLWRTRNALPKSIAIFNNSIKEKKARLTDDSTESTSEPSLAEHLAASLSETVVIESS